MQARVGLLRGGQVPLFRVEPHLLAEQRAHLSKGVAIVERRDLEARAPLVQVRTDVLEQRQVLAQTLLDARLDNLEHTPAGAGTRVGTIAVAQGDNHGHARLGERLGLQGHAERLQGAQFPLDLIAEDLDRHPRRHRLQPLQLPPQPGVQPAVAGQDLPQLVQGGTGPRQDRQPFRRPGRRVERELFGDDRTGARRGQVLHEVPQRGRDRPAIGGVSLRHESRDRRRPAKTIPDGHGPSPPASRSSKPPITTGRGTWPGPETIDGSVCSRADVFRCAVSSPLRAVVLPDWPLPGKPGCPGHVD